MSTWKPKYYYLHWKMEILLSILENGNISIYGGKRKYCCLYWKKGRIHISTGKAHIPVYTGKRIHCNSYVPTDCTNRWPYQYITTFQNVKLMMSIVDIYIYICIYIHIYIYVYHCTSNTIFVWILFIFNSCNSCYDFFFCIECLSIAARDNDNFVCTFFLVMRLNIITVTSCVLFIKKSFPCCSSLKLKKGLKKPLKARSNKAKFVKLVVIFITEYTLFWLGTAIPVVCGLPWMYYENRTRTL